MTIEKKIGLVAQGRDVVDHTLLTYRAITDPGKFAQAR